MATQTAQERPWPQLHSRSQLHGGSNCRHAGPTGSPFTMLQPVKPFGWPLEWLSKSMRGIGFIAHVDLQRERERGSSSAQSHYSTISAEHRTCRWRILEMPACINRRHIQRVGRVAIRHHPPWRRGASVNPGAFDWQGCAVLPLQRRGAAVKLERRLHHALLRERLLRGAQPVLVTTAMIVADAPGDLSQDRSI
jgi:hypothetical protein